MELFENVPTAATLVMWLQQPGSPAVSRILIVEKRVPLYFYPKHTFQSIFDIIRPMRKSKLKDIELTDAHFTEQEILSEQMNRLRYL